MNILGISSFYHDSAACIIQNGKIIAAVQEERFSRIKHDSNFPKKSIKYCLNEAKIAGENLDYIVFYEKPFLKFERLLETYLAFAPRGFKSFAASMPIWLTQKLFQKKYIINHLKDIFGKKFDSYNKLLFSDHHLSHAASAFYPSPFKEAAILTIDGVGEWTTTLLAYGKNENINSIKEINFPHSLGLLYSAFTYYCGFKVNSGEYKLMGLAPYGVPKYSDLIKGNLISINDDGSFKLDLSYFDYCVGLTMTNYKFHKLFNGPPRMPEGELTQKEMDIASSIQKVIEDIIIKIAMNIKEETKSKNLCLAGGVALNCVANGKLLKSKIFENIWVQPASGDAGGALGAALALHYAIEKNKREVSSNMDSMNGSYLGPKYSSNNIEKNLKNFGAVYEKMTIENIINRTANDLANGKAVGWMNGRMEFGPRALGSRSILADARSPNMQKILNLKIKFRESFRPFAPSILREDLKEWFDLDIDSPYMLFISNVKKDKCYQIEKDNLNLFGIDKLNLIRSKIPAVTHVDYTARIQTVHKNTNNDYYNLIKQFKKTTGCPIIVNTSFNIRGEPIVCSPIDAFKCFMGTELDILIIDNFYLNKNSQEMSMIQNYKNEYQLD